MAEWHHKMWCAKVDFSLFLCKMVLLLYIGIDLS